MLLCHQAQAIEQEPNWQKRFEELKQEEIAKFKAPSLGETITIERRIGGSLSGKISAISSNSITIDGKIFQASQLTPTCCDKVFSLYHSANIAKQTTLEEQKNYQARKKEEDIRLAEEKKKAIAERTRMEKEAQLAQEAREQQEQNHREESARLKKEQEQRKDATLSIVLHIALGVLLFSAYILPTLIAKKRGHPNVVAICALNLFLGWTLLGWVGSLIWALISLPADKTKTI